jgi:signal transduction histidine kinase
MTNSQPQTKEGAGRPRRFDAVHIYSMAISGLGVALLLYSLSYVPLFPRSILLFVGLVILAELTTSEALISEMTFSMSSAVCFASLLLYGISPAVLVAMAGAIATTLLTHFRRSGPERAPLLYRRILFNMADCGLAIVAAGSVYLLMGGRIGQAISMSNLVPLVLATVAYELVNSWLVIVVVSLQTSQPAFQIWRQNVSWAMPINLVSMAVGGGALAVGYQIAGMLGVGVFFLPLAMTIYAFRLYVRQTKAQMAHLEEIIAERTHELQEANEELKHLDRTKTNFFSIINHEMRTPLTAVLGYADLLQVGGEDISADDRQRMLNNLRDSGQCLMDLINNILDMARIEDGRLTIVPDIVDLSAVVENVLEMIRPMAENKDISLKADIPPALPCVWGDTRRVSQILTNLLSNAVKYTPDTGVVTVAARRSKTENMLEISVSDTGIGIPPDQLPHLFDRFSRLERLEIRHTMGTGLGLSIVKGLVEAHGGQVRVHNEEGQGTCFTFTLPMVEESSPKVVPPHGLEAKQAQATMGFAGDLSTAVLTTEP